MKKNFNVFEIGQFELDRQDPVFQIKYKQEDLGDSVLNSFGGTFKIKKYEKNRFLQSN